MINPIIQKLQVLHILNEPVRFINTFQGLPVNQPGTILDIRQDHVTFKTTRAQILALQEKPETYFEIDLTSAIYKAKIQEINWQEEVVELSNFEPVSIPVGSRSSVRVNTGKIPVSIFPENRKSPIKTLLIDLSLVGMSLELTKKAYDPAELSPENKFLIKYSLPIEEDGEENLKQISGSGTLKHCIPTHNGKKYRIGIHTVLDFSTEKIVNRYIFQRQINLIQEMRDLSERDSISSPD